MVKPSRHSPAKGDCLCKNGLGQCKLHGSSVCGSGTEWSSARSECVAGGDMCRGKDVIWDDCSKTCSASDAVLTDILRLSLVSCEDKPPVEKRECYLETVLHHGGTESQGEHLYNVGTPNLATTILNHKPLLNRMRVRSNMGE